MASFAVFEKQDDDIRIVPSRAARKSSGSRCFIVWAAILTALSLLNLVLVVRITVALVAENSTRMPEKLTQGTPPSNKIFFLIEAQMNTVSADTNI